MKKILLTISIIVALALVAQAQSTTENNSQSSSANTQQKKKFKKITYNVGVDVGVPVDYLADYSSVAFGGSVQAEYSLLKKLGITASANFIEFVAKRGGKAVPFIPLLGGVHYYFKPTIYASVQAGMSFYGGRDKGDGVGGSGEKYFTALAGVGFRTSKRFDVLFKYEAVYIASSERPYALVGARVGYNFNLR